MLRHAVPSMKPACTGCQRRLQKLTTSSSSCTAWTHSGQASAQCRQDVNCTSSSCPQQLLSVNCLGKVSLLFVLRMMVF